MKDKRIYFLIYRAQRKLQKIANRIFMTSLGVSAVQLGAIFFLLKNDGCLLKELSQGLDMNNSAVTGLTNRMQHAGLVVKQQCTEDGRAFRIFLTQTAKKLPEKAFPIISESNKMLVKDFSEKEIDIVIRFLNRIIELDENKPG